MQPCPSRRTFVAGLLSLPLLNLFKSKSVAVEAESSTKPSVELSVSKPVDLLLLLKCIAEIETGGHDELIGPKGERSRFQLTKTVWERFTKLPFDVCKGYTAEYVARCHLKWLNDNIAHNCAIEKQFREFALAWAWHGGLRSWTDKPSPENHALRLKCNAYAVRVTNLYYDYRKNGQDRKQ